MAKTKNSKNSKNSKDSKDSVAYQFGLMDIHHERVSWSNIIIDSPISYNLLERRAMYYLTKEVKQKFVEKGLGVPDNWKDLYFYLTDEDLGIIGGTKNVPRTYELLSIMGEKFFSIRYRTAEGKVIIGKVHWVDTFFYDQETGKYAVRVSPEIMPYLINLNKCFTTFDVGTALKLRSKYTQKLYEICCRFGGDYRYRDLREEARGNVYKKRVVPIGISVFRQIFNLDEVRDPKTGKLIQAASYENSRDIKRHILNVAQEELLAMFKCHASNVWFDYDTVCAKGRGGKIISIILYVYTKDFPKEGEQRPWQKGDKPLMPYEPKMLPCEQMNLKQRLCSNEFCEYDKDTQDRIVEHFLSKYLTKKEVDYYMAQIRKEAMTCKDTYTQVLTVIQEKEKQKKFAEGTKQYQRNNIKDFVLKENLKAFGWKIDPPHS